MHPNATWTGLLNQAVSLVAGMVVVRGKTKFITLRKVAAYGVILPLLACALVIIAALLASTGLVAKLLFACIALLERLSTDFWSGRTRI